MLRYAFCSRCEVDIPVKSNADTRSNLEDEQGLYLNLACPKCATKKEYHVNQIRAKTSGQGLMTMVGIAIGLGILVTIFFYVLGFYSTFSIILPIAFIGIYYSSKQRAIQNFNKIRINRK